MKNYVKDFPKTKDMKQFFDQAIETHFKFMRSYKDPNPLWLLTLKDSKMNIVCIINDVQASPMQKIKTLIEVQDPDAYVFFALGWSKSLTGGEQGLEKFLNTHKYGTIKDMPDKREVLTVVGRSKDGKDEVQKIFYIKRDSEDKITEFIEDQKPGSMRINLP